MFLYEFPNGRDGGSSGGTSASLTKSVGTTGTGMRGGYGMSLLIEDEEDHEEDEENEQVNVSFTRRYLS